MLDARVGVPCVLLLFLLSLSSLLVPSSSTLFVDSDVGSLDSDRPMVIRDEDTTMEVAAEIARAAEKAQAHAKQIEAQQASLDRLNTSANSMRDALTAVDEIITAQRRLLELQAATIAAQREVIQLLKEKQANVTTDLTNSSSLAASLASLAPRLSVVADSLPATEDQAAQATGQAQEVKRIANEQDRYIRSQLLPASDSQSMSLSALTASSDVRTNLTATAADTNSELGSRLDATVIKAKQIADRVSASESNAAALGTRTSVIESNSAVRTSTSDSHGATLRRLNQTQWDQHMQIDQLIEKQLSLANDLRPMQSTSLVISSQVLDQINVAALLRSRIVALESTNPNSSPMVDFVSALWQRTNEQANAIAALESALLHANATLVNRLTQIELDQLALKSRVASIETRASELEMEAYNNVTTLLAGIDYVSDLILHFSAPQMYRFVFQSNTSWVVPAGVNSGFITLAGGGGTGYGWRFAQVLHTGASGGYMFSYPIALESGERLNITIGRGATEPSFTTGGIAFNGYDILLPPAGTDGFSGSPGGATFITSPSKGELIRCAGGSGMAPLALDTYDDGGSNLVAGMLTAAMYGSGHESIVLNYTARAFGPFTRDNGPGACGEDDLGLGIRGIENFSSATALSGTWNGGATPFVFGSGGAAIRSGCMVGYLPMGICTWALNAQPGITIIDLMYSL